MSFFDKLQDSMAKTINPIAVKLSKNKSICAIQEGMMMTMPLTIGISVITILTNLPFEPWLNLLRATGIYATGQMMMMAVLNLLALYIVVAVSYSYAKNAGYNPITVCLLTLASFVCLMPQMIMVGEERVPGLYQSKLGSDGVFVAMILGILIPKLYGWLKTKNLTLKLPESVPSMVSESLSPIFISMIIFLIIAAVRTIFAFTPYEDIFVFINTVIAAPIMKFGASPWALLIVYTITNLLWFFGIHPSAITSVYRPVTTAAMTAATAAFAAGEPIPYVPLLILGMCVIAGGTGNTLGMCIQACFAKSARFKAVGRTAVVPNLFNINEPVLFGFPVILNPVFFVPMVLSSLIPGALITLIMNMIGTIPFDPTINLPWVTPAVISGFARGGFLVAGLILLYIVLGWILYLPFFKIADNDAWKEEQASLSSPTEEEEDDKDLFDI